MTFFRIQFLWHKISTIPKTVCWASILIFNLVFSNYSRAQNPIYNLPNIRQELSGTYTNDVIIYEGNFVRCKGTTVRFDQGHGIIVKQGGILYLDGCIITHVNDNFDNLLGEFWDGIFVESNPKFSQDNVVQLTCSEKFDKMNTKASPLAIWGEVYAGQMQTNPGVVISKASEIRHAIIALSFGDILNDYSHQVDAGGDKGGGYLYCENSKFTNNYNAAISFAPYVYHLQQSAIYKDTFGFYITVVPYAPIRAPRGIIAALNNFGHPIYRNYFLRGNNCPWPFVRGIDMFQSNATIRENKFTRIVESIHENSTATNLFKSILIANNIANDCNNIFSIWSSDFCEVFKNHIVVKDAAISGVPSRFFNSGIFSARDAKVYMNNYRNQQPANTNCVGIWVGSLIPTPIGVFKNTFVNLNNGYELDHNSKGNIFDCNDFKINTSTSSSLNDIGMTPAINSTATSYGSTRNPLRNKFTQSIPTNFHSAFSSSSSLTYRYFYSNTNGWYQPIRINTPITSQVSSGSGNICNSILEPTLLTPTFCLEKKKTKIPTMGNGWVLGRSNLYALGDSTYDVDLKRFMKMDTIKAKIFEYTTNFCDTFASSYYLGIDSILEYIPDTIDYYYYKAWNYLNHRDTNVWNVIKSQLNSIDDYHNELKDLSSYIDIYAILLDSNFKDSVALIYKTDLDSIKARLTLVAPMATHLCCYLFNEGCIDTGISYPDTLLASIDSFNFTYGPNPFDNLIDVLVANDYTTLKSFTIKVFEFGSFTSIYSSTQNINGLNDLNFAVNSSAWSVEYYIVQVQTGGALKSAIVYRQ